ncbi:MAG: DUF3413 domain-containing protein [Pseudomonadales bacterium]|nr:DUF3413 domain-containing protein [Pseudomonadales bacterium]
MGNIDFSFRQRLTWAFSLILANGLIATLIALSFLKWMTIEDSYTTLYLMTVYGGQFFLLALLLGAPLLILTVFSWRILLMSFATVWATVLICLLLLDTIIYAQYRFHFSGFILELVTQAGGEVFSFSWQTWVEAGLFVTGILVGEAFLVWFMFYFRPKGRWLVSALMLVLGLQITAHSWHAWADANYDNRITALTRHIPLYYAATAKRFFRSKGLVDPQQVRNQAQSARLASIKPASDQLDYPKRPMSCSPPKSKHNILIIVVDSLRYDMLDKRWMPALFEFSQSALVFHNHRSNGNATKPGIFTLFYGVPASYWDSFAASRTPPLLIQRIQDLGYVTQILSSATLISPAFDRNVFSSVKDLRLRTPGKDAWQQDERITEDWLTFLDDWQKKEGSSPFFGFLFYDSPHSFEPPPDFPRYEPFWDPINVLELNNDFDPEPYLNVYKTTVKYTDMLIGKVLDDLEEKGLKQDTIVLVTSDHGQEFNENGKNYWGHGSNFSDYQLWVPLVVHWPGKERSDIKRETVHFDIAPTLLRGALGCAATPADNIASDFGLFEGQSRNWTIAHSYMNYALLADETIFIANPVGNVDILDKHLDPKKSFHMTKELIGNVLEELSRFHK